MNEKLLAYWQALALQPLPPERERKLRQVGNVLRQALPEAGSAQALQLVWVCNHNARRSQLAQAWSTVWMGHQPGLSIVSAGEASTVPHPGAVRALLAAGFSGNIAAGPPYTLHTGTSEVRLSSKRIEELPPHPRRFVLSVCTASDANCPLVPGAQYRFSLPFADPKVADGTPEELSRYLQCSAEIGRQVQLLAGFAGFLTPLSQ